MGKLSEMLKSILERLPARYILLESVPDISDNAKPVFDELIRRGLNRKYKFVWLCRDPLLDYPKIKNVIYLPPISTRIDQWKCSYYHIRVKLALSCNRTIETNSLNKGGQHKTQITDSKLQRRLYVHLDHGSPFKDARFCRNLTEHYDYLLCASQQMMPYRMVTFNIKDANKMLCLGYPRNDIFSKSPKDFHKVFKMSFIKLIVWMPTFRQHKNKKNTVSTATIPILHEVEQSKELNKWAVEHNTILVIKPHYAQDVSYIKDLNLSNILFVDDQFLRANGVTSYDLLNASDALLTDYSSVYYDYTLHDKPIGLIWEDIDIYKANRGLVPDYEFCSKGGEKIYQFNELISFLDHVVQGIDTLKKERRIIRDCSNISTDGKNTERVVDYIIEKAHLCDEQNI